MSDARPTKRSDYSFGEVRVDGDNFNVVCAGQAKALTPRAFDVLVYLIENRGRVVEKRELFEAVWGETFVTDSALTRTIKEIRRVLADNASAPRFIETVHKRGYKFIAEPNEAVEDSLGPEAGSLGVETSETSFRPADEGREVQPGHSRSLARNRPLIAAVVMGACLLGAAGVWLLVGRGEKRIDTIAVLPFANESGNADLDYLSDGMTETLIDNLSQLPELKVKARSTVFRYKGRESEARSIGAELAVHAIVTGRVIQRGEDITIFLSMVDANSGNNLWSQQYDRRLTNLVSLQREIALDVAEKLGTRLSRDSGQTFTRNYTENAAAYQLYLKGRYHVLTTRQSGPETGITYYREALAIDPNYALAHAALAEAYLGLAFRNEALATEVFPQARASAQRAVEIDPALPEGQIALAQASFWFDWDWNEAENRLRRALEIDADNAEANLLCGALLFNTGRRSEGLVHLQRSVTREPLNLRNNIVYAQYLNFAGAPDESLRVTNKVLELEPGFYLAHLTASQAYIEKAMFADAIRSARLAKGLNSVDSTPTAFLAFALARSRDQHAAEKLRSELLAQVEGGRYVTPYNIALIHNGLDKTNETLDWLERGVNQRDPRMTFLIAEPKWNNLRSNTRFREILNRVGLGE